MATAIINRGRGPEIIGTRITVYDVLDYHLDGWHHSTIAAWFRISSEEVQAALRYYEEHKDEVMAAYQRILERSEAGNPPELRARLEATHAEFDEKLRRKQAQEPKEIGGDGTAGGY